MLKIINIFLFLKIRKQHSELIRASELMHREMFLPLKDQRCVIGEEVVKSVISENKVPVSSFSVKFSSRFRAR